MQEKALYTIVVADDEDELREALCRMIPFEELGFRLVGSAGNGLDALELVETLEPDLLLTDIRMPFISGIELARQVREIRPSMHIAFLSGYDDFEYAKQAIQYNIISYMLKPISREGLVKELTVIREKMDAQFQAFREESQSLASRSGFLMTLLLDDYPEGVVSEEQLHRQAVENGLLEDAADRPLYVAASICLTDEGGENRTTASMVRSMGTIARKYFRRAGFYSSGKVVFILMGNESDFEEYLHILANEWVQLSERVLHVYCRVGISRTTSRLTHLHRAYRELMENISFSTPEQSQTMFLTDSKPMSARHADSLNERVSSLENALRRGDREQLCREVEQLVELADSEAQNKNWINMAVLQLVSGIHRILYTAGGGEAITAFESRSQFDGMNFHYHSAAELKSILQEFCLCALDTLVGMQKKGGDRLCRQALEAIDQHYQDEDLSLVSLSGMLNVSPNHLSACIKKNTGESFINVLIGRRMTAAKELLLTTPMKIMEVAQQCGYSDQHYFSYCFKKYCGMTPNMLRNQAKEREKGAEQ